MTVKILHGDARTVLKSLASDSVHCVVTSPPYWGLRSYLPEGHADKHLEIGSEPTLQEWVDTMVEVFREVRRVLRPDGTLWLNLGDAYAGSWGSQGREYSGVAESALSARQIMASQRKATGTGSIDRLPGLKPKDMMGQPWRVAFALQQPYYTGQIKNEADRVWLAAIIDGEGCFFIHKRKAGTSAHSKFTRADGSEASYSRTVDTYGAGLEICNTNRAIIDRIQVIAGAGTTTSQSPAQNNRRKQTIYRWRVGPNEAKRIAQECYPHLVGKQHQARLLFACPSSGEAGAAAHQAMMDLHNGIATDVDFPEPPSLLEPGWYLRQEVIWSKNNPMPESVRDRCTKAHEHVFLLSKSERYWYGFEAMQEPVNGGAHARRSIEHSGAKRPGFGHGYDAVPKARYKTPDGWDTRRGEGGHGSFHKEGREKGHVPNVGRREGPPGNPAESKYGQLTGQNSDGMNRTKAGLNKPGSDTKNNASMDEALADMRDTRNPRSVWTIPTHGFKGAHFATFPPALAERCITAGCPEGGTVLDPFGGSGTVGMVADRQHKNAILIDLDERNVPMATERITGDSPLFAEVAA